MFDGEEKETVEPSGLDTNSQSVGSEGTEKDVPSPKPDTAKPDTAKPDTTKPDTTKPDTTKPDTAPDKKKEFEERGGTKKYERPVKGYIKEYPAGGKKYSFRKRVSYFTRNPEAKIDYKRVDILVRFTSDKGRILQRKYTGLTALQQRKVAKAIKRARHAGLLPFSVK